MHNFPHWLTAAGILGGSVIAPLALGQSAGTGQVRHGLTINGSNRVEGSLRSHRRAMSLTAPGRHRGFACAGHARDSVRRQSKLRGTLQGSGSAQPSNYAVSGNGSFSLRHVILRRTRSRCRW